jgi:predicted DNA binding CopG/RHH family protein
MEKIDHRITVRMDKEDIKALRKYCIDNDTSVQKFVHETLVDFLKSEEYLD